MSTRNVSPTGDAPAPSDPGDLLLRLRSGAQWASGCGRPKLAGLLQALAEEIDTLREGPDLGGLEPQDIEGRLYELEEAEHQHQIAITDLELDTRHLESRATQLESELSELQEQMETVQTQVAHGRAPRAQRRRGVRSCADRSRAPKAPP